MRAGERRTAYGLCKSPRCDPKNQRCVTRLSSHNRKGPKTDIWSILPGFSIGQLLLLSILKKKRENPNDIFKKDRNCGNLQPPAGSICLSCLQGGSLLDLGDASALGADLSQWQANHRMEGAAKRDWLVEEQVRELSGFVLRKRRKKKK